MKRRIAVLGGGILGSCIALELARRRREVVLIDGADDVMQGASRWNEGKIHLGFVYAGDPTFNTAKRLIPGGLAFGECLTRLLDRPLDHLITDEDETFLLHRDSVVDAPSFLGYGRRTATLLREAASVPGAPRYLTDVRSAEVRQLTAAELAAVTGAEEIVAGFRVPERSISTVAVADLVRQAVHENPRIEVRARRWVNAVHRRGDGGLEVETQAAPAQSDREPFDVVINALWEGRPAVDATLGIQPPAPWTHRFRASVYGHARIADLRSAVVCTGPFGDVKRYGDGRIYASWYVCGLIALGEALEPPRSEAVLTASRRQAVLEGTLDTLSKFVPALEGAREQADRLEVHGGWVYALGQGSLADRASTLHRRDAFNMTVDRGYISIDTAKYSIAPWLAAGVAEQVTGG